MNIFFTKALFLTAFLAIFAGCDDGILPTPGGDMGKPENTGGADNAEGFAGTIVPIPAAPVSIDYQSFADKVTAYSGIGSVEVDWAALDSGAQDAYLNQTDREAFIWLNLMRTRPYLFTNMMRWDDDAGSTGTWIEDANLLNQQFPEWNMGTSKALYLAARDLAAHFGCSDSWDTNKYIKGFTIARFIDSGSAGYFYVVDGNSVESFISKFQMKMGEYAMELFQWHTRASNGRGPAPAEANMAAVAVEGTICVIAFGKDIVGKANLPDNIIAGNNEKLYYQYAGDTTAADLQRNESFGITWKDTSRIFDVQDILKNKAAEIVGDAAGERQKTERILRWMIDSFDYDYSYISSGANALGILEALNRPVGEPGHDHLIVCAEYARLMTALCRAAGLKARYIEGLVTNNMDICATDWLDHAWVQVFIDGQWHMSDPTWNDTGAPNGVLYLFPGAVNADNEHLLRF